MADERLREHILNAMKLWSKSEKTGKLYIVCESNDDGRIDTFVNLPVDMIQDMIAEAIVAYDEHLNVKEALQ